MKWLSSLLDFIKELFSYTKWFTERKDLREERANKTQAAKQFEENDKAITDHFNRDNK